MENPGIMESAMTMDITANLARKAAAECAGAGRAAFVLATIGALPGQIAVAEHAAHGHFVRFDRLWTAALAAGARADQGPRQFSGTQYGPAVGRLGRV